MKKLMLALVLSLWASNAHADWDGFEYYQYKCDPKNDSVSVEATGFNERTKEEKDFEEAMISKYHFNKDYKDKHNYLYSERALRIMAEKGNVLTLSGSRTAKTDDVHIATGEFERICKLPSGYIKIKLDMSEYINGDCVGPTIGSIEVLLVDKKSKKQKLIYQNTMNDCGRGSSLAAVKIDNGVLQEYMQKNDDEFQYHPIGTYDREKGKFYNIDK